MFATAVSERRWIDALVLRDRHDGPSLLANWRDDLTRDELRVVLPHVWQMAEWPVAGSFGVNWWIELWRAAGFVSTAGSRPPSAPLRVFRGDCAAGGGFGLSWTTRLGVARWFAARWEILGQQQGAVFELLVPPRALLAMIDDEDDHQEHEIVIDPRGLEQPRRLTRRVAPD